jgi:hypothetical protein
MGKLFKILAVSNALAMTLPLGWCCPSPIAAAESETALPAPCPHCQPQQSPDDESAPAAPDSGEKCPCCQVRATTSGEEAGAAPVAQGRTSLVAAIDPELPRIRGFEPAQFIHPTGPSLQILHCVWRC